METMNLEDKKPLESEIHEKVTEDELDDTMEIDSSQKQDEFNFSEGTEKVTLFFQFCFCAS